jgi:hypothetical protein
MRFHGSEAGWMKRVRLSPVWVILIQALRMKFVRRALPSETPFAASMAATPKKLAALPKF